MWRRIIPRVPGGERKKGKKGRDGPVCGGEEFVHVDLHQGLREKRHTTASTQFREHDVFRYQFDILIPLAFLTKGVYTQQQHLLFIPHMPNCGTISEPSR